MVLLSCLLQIRVAHFQPDTIRLRGIGVFQRITLSLPRDEELPAYQKLHDQAQENLTRKDSDLNQVCTVINFNIFCAPTGSLNINQNIVF